MAKITHTTLIYTDLSELNEIPSEYIEPYLQKFLMYMLECVACGFKKPEEARQELKAIESFVGIFCGLHARIATTNVFFKYINLSDENMINVAKETFKSIA